MRTQLTSSNQLIAARPYVLIALIAISTAGAVIYSASAYGALTIPRDNEPVVVIEIQPLINGKAVALSKDMAVVVFITAPLPPSMLKESERDTKVVFAGVINRFAVLTKKEIRPIIEGWVKAFKGRGVDGDTYVGLSVHIDIVNKTAKENVLAGLQSVSLNTDLLMKGYIAHCMLGVDVSKQSKAEVASPRIVSINYYDLPTARTKYWYWALSPERGQTNSNTLGDYDRCVDIGNGLEECYKLTYYADVDDFAEVLPSKYFRVVGGITYMKIPVLVAMNDFPLMSATVTVSITTLMNNPVIGIYPTYAIGPDVANAIKNPNYSEFPSVTIWKGGGLVWGGERFDFYRSLTLHPRDETNSSWVWIYARPYIEIYSVYLVTDSGIDAHQDMYLRDDVTFSITDVLVNGNTIESGYAYGIPHEIINNYFFAGTNETYVTRLAPRESITLRNIFQTFDTCGADFEVGIPVGAVVAVAASLVVPISAPVAAGLAGFHVSMSAVGASIQIQGGVQNDGDVPGVSGDYNVSEHVYIRVSKFKYKVDPPWWCFWCSPCYYDVPAGVYFRFH